MAYSGVKGSQNSQPKDQNEQFFKVKGPFRSKITVSTSVQQRPIPSNSNKKVDKLNVILIPDYSYLAQSRNRENAAPSKRARRKSSFGIDTDYVHDPKRSKATEEDRLSLLFQERSLIAKYLWDKSEKTQVNSRRINIVYQQNRSTFNNNQIPHYQRNQIDEHFGQIQNLSILSLSQKKSSIHYSIKKRQSLERQIENLPRQISQRVRPLNQSKVSKELNIDVWNSHGLKYGSNILKFGIRNKNIAIIVHHIPQPTDLKMIAQKSQDSFIFKSNSAFVMLSDTTKKWTKFIRQVNKKCIIAHLYIQEIGNQKMEENGITIKKAEVENQYVINFKVLREKNNQNNGNRLSHIIDQLLEKQKQNQFPDVYSGPFSLLQPKDSLILREHSGIVRYLKLKRQKSKNKDQARLDLDCPQQLDLHLRNSVVFPKPENRLISPPLPPANRGTSPKNQKLSVVSKELSKTMTLRKQKNQGIFNYIKKLCCTQTNIQQSVLENEGARIENFDLKQRKVQRKSSCTM